MLLNILLTLFLVFLNGFFVAAEFAIVKVRLSQIEMKIRTGSSIAKIAKNMKNNLDAYLSATQLGITLASLGLGWIGESVVSEIIIDIMWLLSLSITPEDAHKIALPFAFLTITILHIVFGELAPKTIAIQRSEATTIAISIPLKIFYIVFSPFIWVLNSLSNKILKIFGFQPAGDIEHQHSSEELRYLLEESSKTGALDSSEHKLIENVFEFYDTPVKQIMVPRGKIYGIEISSNINDILEEIIDEGFSRMPVYKKTIDNIIGVIYAKDLIPVMRHRDLIVLHDVFRPVYFVDENEKISKLFREMQRNKNHIAIALDEFGGTAGMVTMEDIIEEIMGEIQDEYDEEQPSVEVIADGVFKVLATTAIDDANDQLPIPLTEGEDYETVGGLVISNIGRIPELNEVINIDDYTFQVIKSSTRNIECLKLTLNRKQDIEIDE